jgi:HK97 family phage major capsid protein
VELNKVKISLEQLSRNIGDQRRALGVASENFQAKIKAYQEAGKAVEDFRSTNSGDLSDEQKTQLTALVDTKQKARLEMMAASDEANRLKSALADSEADFTVAQSSNALDDFLSSSNGGVNGISNGRLGGDGASLNDAGGLSSNIRVLPPNQQQMEHNLGVYFQSMMMGQVDHKDPAEVAKNYFKNDHVAAAMTAHDFSRGGSFVQGEYANFYIGLLAQRAVLRSCGVPTIPIVNGSMTIPKISDGVMGGYRGEEQRMNPEDIKTSDVTLTPKEMYVMVAMTLKLMRVASASASTMVREEMLRAGSVLEDRYFLRGLASGAGPTGLRWRAAAANIVPFVKAGATTQRVINFIEMLQLKLTQASVDLENPWWITNPIIISYLKTLVNANNLPVFPEINQGKIGLYPFKMTNIVPANIGTAVLAANGAPSAAAAGYSELMFLDVGKQIIGDVPGLTLDMSKDASYVNASGQTVNCFTAGQVLFKLTAENDIHTRYEESIAVGVDLDWTVAQ